MPTRPSAHRILRRTVQLSVRRAVVVTAGTVLAVTAAPAHGLLDTSGTHGQHLTRADRIVATHDCWSGAAPAGVEPTHAVVTLPGQVARRVPAGVGYGIWLDHDPGVLHAFCR
jgi:hypothetical protein